MTEEEIDIEKKCYSCLLKDDCYIKDLKTEICVWYFDESKYQIVEEKESTYIVEIETKEVVW